MSIFLFQLDSVPHSFNELEDSKSSPGILSENPVIQNAVSYVLTAHQLYLYQEHMVVKI